MADEEMYESQARSWLEGVDVPPPRLDVAQIVQDGRSQVRRRRMLAAGGTVAALAALAAVPVTVPLLGSGGGGGGAPGLAASLPVLDCEVTELAIPGGLPALEPSQFWMVRTTEIDPSGRIIVGSAAVGPIVTEVSQQGDVTSVETEGGEPAVTIMWRDGVPTLIPSLAGVSVTGVNSHGVVIGGGLVYRDGAAVPLAVPDGFHEVFAESINEAGDIAGYAIVEVPESDDTRWVTAAVKWPASDPGSPQLLAQVEPGTDRVWAQADAILDDGTVVGTITRENEGEGDPYRWDPDGGQHALPMPATAIGASVGPARGDWVVGAAIVERLAQTGAPEPDPPAPSASDSPAPSEADRGGMWFVPVRWNLRTGTVERLDGDENNGLIPGAVVNSSGDVLLAVFDGRPGSVESTMGILIRDGDRYALPTPTDGPYQTSGISDDGRVMAGYSVAAQSPVPGEENEQSRSYQIMGGIPDVPLVWHC